MFLVSLDEFLFINIVLYKCSFVKMSLLYAININVTMGK